MRIRNASEFDKASVLEFCKNTFSWGDYISDVWDSWNSKGRLYVLEEDGRIAGVYNLTISEKQAWVEGMRVHPQYRRRGIGSSMLAHAESVVPSKIMRLIIDSENHQSISLVESMGYRLEDKWRLYSMTPRKERSTVRNAVDLSLRFIQNKASELQFERIQVFAQEKIPLQMSFLDKRSLFYLMRKDSEKPFVMK
ncbi:MAG: GNAT family N-acetyltransferase [Thaumarchaeota archaeon]|nr:MAG: GNAT family N-acetyltransferase [Nitrososphaerota archaeon]